VTLEGESLTIRSAVSTDIADLIDMDHSYSTDHVWQMGYTTDVDEVAVAFREVRLPRPMRVEYPRNPDLLADEWTRKQVFLVAEQEGRPVAYLTLSQPPALQSAWISDLVVESARRRQGIATHLLNQARGWCKQQGLSRLFLEMQIKNYPAICLARKLGFVFSGYSDHHYLDQDIAIFFSLEIR
jgi:GNAT superfamily N-acetyltransferase